MGTKMLDKKYLDLLASEFTIPIADVLLIAINRYGIKADVPDKRLRFKLKLACCKEVFYLAVGINTFDSPFYFDKDGNIYMNQEKIGDIFDIENDTCDTTYFRRNKTVMTLNSNMRSECQGCTFCGTYNLDPDDKIDMSDANKIAAYLEGLIKENHLEDLSSLVRVSICTGCFKDEVKLMEHILTVHNVFYEFGFNKRLHYIGSQIRSKEVMHTIKSKIPSFSLSLTVECFTERELRMRKDKASLDLSGIKNVLKSCMECDFPTNYLYILGLDKLSVFEKGTQELSGFVNRLPLFQVMQNYRVEHEDQRVQDAIELDYYLKARKIIEGIFWKEGLRPRSWENYRSIFYTSYQNKPLDCIRI